MAVSAERRMVLEMVREKRITPDEGAQLIEALAGLSIQPEMSEASSGARREGVDRPRWVRMRVTDAASGSLRVNLRLPVGLVEGGIRAGARLTPEVGGSSWGAS